MAVIFSEDWSGSDDDPWDDGRWPTIDASSNVVIDIQGNRGNVELNSSPERPVMYALADHQVVSDFDMLFDWTPVDGNAFRLGVIFGHTGPTAGNILTLRPFGDAIQIHNLINLNANLDGNATQAVITAGTQVVNESVAFSDPDTTRYACRVQRDGNTIRVRVWEHGGSEPGTWDVEETLTSHPTGTIGIYSMAHNTPGGNPELAFGPITIESDDEPPVEIGAPDNVQVTITGPTEATVTWDPVDGADAYQVEARVRAGVEEE